VIAASAAAYFYYFRPERQPAEPAAPTPSGVSPSDVSGTPAIQAPAPVAENPPEPSEPEEPLPSLAESDAVVRPALEALWGKPVVGRFLVRDDLVSRFVATIDNLPNPRIALKLRPVLPFEGSARARPAAAPSRMVLGEEHFARYAPLVGLVEATSVDQLEALYMRFYPLLQQAYEDLGYSGESFEERLIEVIDHLLQTPEVPIPIAVVRPKVYYEFADREIEERSAGQKLLIRMGPRNAAIVKRKLRAMRDRLSAGAAADGS
jgi:hypothetical protein